MPSAISTVRINEDDASSSASEELALHIASLRLSRLQDNNEQKSLGEALREVLRTDHAVAVLPALLPVKPEPPLQSCSRGPFFSSALRNLQFELQDEGTAGSFPGITASPIDYANIVSVTTS